MKNKKDKTQKPKVIDEKFVAFFKSLNIEPQNWQFYEDAFVHSSYVNENEDARASYDRLEFLGDALIDFIVAKKLFELYPNYNEGMLTRTKIEIVKGENLNRIGKELNFGNFIKLGKGMPYTETLFGDVLEALVAAIYEDLGIEKANQFVEEHIFKKTYSEILKYNFFSLFQEQKLPEPRVRVSLTSNNLVLSIIELNGDIIWSQAVPNSKHYDDKSVLEHNAMSAFTQFLKSGKGINFFSDIKNKLDSQKPMRALTVRPKKINWKARKPKLKALKNKVKADS
ncbi:ribonuclease III [Mycoplasmoides pneumoniae]|uniref:Ribonuclease 3 n=4 Tax=Mycoplasmoides pneumoniae TaxID=2104 RepID=RNC_MYCPN|nr:ribonuclease III [Mycoplasmoides pneumoniae]E1QCT1.1 RecName: Full=Ribonuclease 3; AltName: Full=Ribonuclease III; Short=RNase III [Mycoplasmoides pneumoniae FH]P75233.1 RecName: Full=Ribonuclease 3; AltName: Full=Ribonuclease III; Short=RNase III [Mycoplasmoides pneumoniae M129]AAB95945.1 ribonuclease III [Mycoplasmoides pneumoniae M129]ADK87079.1 ribonuclease III [Mycoplasmoides pneumoniae FH]AGC04431.1 ribonuclease III [Mycoplasmoides pneumoniae M129-B7]ALA30421.1 ribonuclease III [Myco